MQITKIETNYKRKIFFENYNVKSKKYNEKLENQIINIYPKVKYQSIIGFGGAITEATAISFFSLPKNKQNEMLKEYFSSEGANYSLCRLPIGSCDFSEKSYSYSSNPDLSDFSIEKDKKYIIPFIKQAQKLNPNLKFLSSPWSPPKFMKSNKMLVLGGKLLNTYKKTWAEYLVKYIKAYEKENININYLTVQNEPNGIQILESCLYSPEEEKDFVINYLFPIFQENNIDTKILIWDHNKEKLFTRASNELNDNNSLNSISGIAFHWYTGDHFENISLTKDFFPGKLLIHTEGCTGYSKFSPNDEVKNAEIYAHDILGDLNSGINGYIDWNMCLNYKGGPNHKKNFCNSPIMVNNEKNDYIKNLSFYYIKHFSHFIKPSATKLGFSRYTDNIEITAFENNDNSIVIVLLNKNNFNKEYNLVINNEVIHDNLDSNAIVTYLIK